MAVWIVAAVAAAWLAWREWERPVRAHRALRVTATIVAAGALALLAIRPARSVTASADTILVATPGVTAERMRALQDSLRPSRVVDARDAESGFRTLGDLPRGATVVLAGWGLLPSQLAGGEGIALVHDAAPLPSGVQALWTTPDPRVGDPLQVRGTVAADTGWIVLADAAGPVDSMRMASRETAFRLEHTPRAPGPILLTLTRGTVVESIGVSVREAVPPRLLVLEHGPSFETTALRRWVAERGGVLASRTRVSQDRWRRDFAGMPARSLARVDAALLADFDVVVADGGALGALPATERAALAAAVRGGTGLLVIADVPAFERVAGALGVPLTLRRIEGLDARQVRPVWWPRTAPATPPVDAEAVEFAPAFAQEVLVRDQAGQPLAIRTPLGLGQVAMTTVLTTSRWQFEGDGTWEAWWATLLRAVAPEPGPRWTVETAVPRVDHPVEVTLVTREPPPAAWLHLPDGNRLRAALVQDPLDPARWTGRFHPRTDGWHGLVAGSAEAAVLVGTPGAGRDAAERLAVTARATLHAGSTAGSTATATLRVPVPPFWFAGLFLLAAGYLWWEARITTPAVRTDETRDPS